MLTDLHIHTCNSSCAQRTMTVEAIIKAAAATGLDGVGLTDHLHPHTDNAILEENRHQLLSMHDIPVTAWVGVEVDVLTITGEITGEPELFRSVDYVLAGVHHFHAKWVEGPDLAQSPTDVLYYAHRQLIGAIRNPWVNALAHPWVGLFKYLKGFNFSYDLLKKEWIEELGVEAKNNQTAIEIPSWAMFTKGGAPDEDYLRTIVRPLIKTRCPLMTGTDAHRPEQVGSQVSAVTSILLHEGAAQIQLWSPAKLCDHSGEKLY